MSTFKPIPESQYMKNPGYLKLDLMLRGIRCDSSLFRQGALLEKYELTPGLFGNLDLVLPDDTYVSVPYQEPFAGDSPYKLRLIRNKCYVAGRDETIPATVIRHPDFYEQKVNQNVRVGDVAACHGGYVSLALGGHRYLQPHLSTTADIPYRPELILSVDETIAVLERVRKSQSIDVVTLSSWSTQSEDGGILQIEPYIRAIKSSFNLLLFVEVHLPLATHWIDRTYAMGADSVCYHLGDLCSHAISTTFHESAGRKKPAEELQSLKYAVSIFPPGSILSHVTMGNRPFEEVMEDIDSLTAIKVLPILTVVSLEAAHQAALSTGQLAPMFGYVYNAAKKNRIPMNWFSKLAPFIAPMEGRFFSGDMPRLKLALLNFYQSRLFGSSISAALSNLRRRLRVREVKK